MNSVRFTMQEITRATGARHRPRRSARNALQDTLGADVPRDADGCVGISTDSRSLRGGALFVALVGPRFDGHDYLARVCDLGALGAVVTRGAAGIDAVAGQMHIFEVEDTLAALGDLARHHRERFENLKTASITGSNGKTTTKELLAAAMSPIGLGLSTEGNLNNLVGVPLTLFRLREEHRFAVVEMGMNEPGEIARLTSISAPSLGVVTTASEVHLAGLGDVDAVAAAKAELYEGLSDGAVAVVNLDDPRLPALAEKAGAIEAGGRLQRVTYGSHPRADVRLGEVSLADDGTVQFQALVSVRLFHDSGVGPIETSRGSTDHLIQTVRLPLLGRHNAHNACGALAAAIALGVLPSAAAEAISGVRLLPRRLEPKRGPRGSLIIDDCYNAGPASVVAALETSAELVSARGGRLLVVLGDMLELGEREEELHREIGKAAAEAGASLLIAVGDRSGATARSAREAGIEQVLHREDVDGLLDRLVDAVEPADVILLKGSRGVALERIADPLSMLADASSRPGFREANEKEAKQ